MNSAEAAYRALVVRKNPDRSFAASVESLRAAELPAGEVTVRGRWSSLNYKDALSISGHPGITRTFPHVPGIDVAGNVVASTSTDFAPGAEVIVTGFEFGSQRWGGYAELTRVPAEWVVPLPPGLTAREAMVLGTAGFTAAQCVQALQHEGVAPSDGPIAVTGASGGVGTLAVALLARLGYRVSAVSGKPAAHNLLKQLGAAEILSRRRGRLQRQAVACRSLGRSRGHGRRKYLGNVDPYHEHRRLRHRLRSRRRHGSEADGLSIHSPGRPADRH